MIQIDNAKIALKKTGWSVMWLVLLMLLGYGFAHNEHHHKNGTADHSWKDDLLNTTNHTELFLRFVLGSLIILGSILRIGY